MEAVEEVEEEREFEGGVTGTHSDKQLRVKKVASNSCKTQLPAQCETSALTSEEETHLETIGFIWRRNLIDLLIRQFNQRG